MRELPESKSAFRISVEKRIVRFIRRFIIPVFAKIVNFLESKGITKRRIKGLWLTSSRITLYMIVSLVVPLVAVVMAASFFVGVQLHLLDLQLFITLWAAEVPIAIVLRLLMKEAKPASPQLSMNYWEWKMERKNVTVVSVLVHNGGDNVAASCRAKIILNDLEKEDVLTLEEVKAKFSEKNFEPTVTSDLSWERGIREKTIRPDDTARVPVMRLVHSKDKRLSHYEIPSEKGWKPITIALKPSYFYGRLKVTLLNGKPIVQKFEVSFDSDTRMTNFTLS